MGAGMDVCKLFAANPSLFADNAGSYALLVIAACHGGTGELVLTTTPEQKLRCEQEPLAQEVELGTPKHGSLQHLQAINLAFDGAITPPHTKSDE
jgi:hypothetical protein